MNWAHMHVSVIQDSQEMALKLVKIWMSVLLAVMTVMLMLCVRTGLEVFCAAATLATVAVELSAVVWMGK
jgi:hypothetical protein